MGKLLKGGGDVIQGRILIMEMQYLISKNVQNFLLFSQCFEIYSYLSKKQFIFYILSTLYVVVAMPFTTEAVDYTVGTLVESNVKSCLKFLCSNDTI